MAAEQVDTIVGAQVEIKGSLHNAGSIHIHGTVTGDIVSGSAVIVGETAVINGPITAKQVDIAGRVHGSITAEEHIELQPKSVVQGDLITNRLSIKPGAFFAGKSQMQLPTDAANPEPSEKKKPRLEIE